MRPPVDTSGRRAKVVEVPELLDMPAVAALMATSVRHVQRLVSERRIPYLKVGRFVRFDPAEVIAWLDEQRVEMYVPPHLAHRYGR
jgi:excisionase family DNA binding protein